ncbi:hypothetical protein ACP70R_020778 [Stipagrostis hirtigluma subsp. patula]
MAILHFSFPWPILRCISSGGTSEANFCYGGGDVMSIPGRIDDRASLLVWQGALELLIVT